MYGDRTIDMVEALVGEGVDHVALLMRHSAREFDPDVHDLVNPLTDEGRDLSRRFGHALPKSHTVRGYASPAERCVETAELAVEGHNAAGGSATRVRPVDGLGVFYALDQMKMFRVMREADHLGDFVSRWGEGHAPRDAMIPAPQAAEFVFRVVAEKLEQPVAERQIDLCVSHDITLLLVVEQLLATKAREHTVEFLDAVAFFKQDGALHLANVDGTRRRLT